MTKAMGVGCWSDITTIVPVRMPITEKREYAVWKKRTAVELLRKKT